jgi:hypothetical protein
MSVILGTMTTVNIDGYTDGFQSISWNIDLQPTRLWQLGQWVPYKTQVAGNVSVSLSTYAGTLISQVLQASTSCTDSNAKRRVVFSATACDLSAAVSFDKDMFINSYSYAKEDPVGFATESWSFQAWLDTTDPEFADLINNSNYIVVGAPSVVLQGITEGSRSGDVGNGTSDLGVVFEPGTEVTGKQGSVSAGTPGVGNADSTTLGIVTTIGGGLLQAGGQTGRSSATIPHQPLYL